MLSCLLLGVTLGLNSPSTHSRGRVVAYVAYWDQGPGFASAERHHDTLSAISPWWYAVDYAGDVVPQHTGMTDIDASTARRFSTGGTRVMPTIANHRDGEWDDQVVAQLLAQDYQAIGAAADEVRIMTYDYHWATSRPGPVAPVGWVDEVIASTVRLVGCTRVVARD